MILNLEEQSSREILRKAYDEYKSMRSLSEKIRDYYRGQTDAISNYPVTDRCNRKCNSNFMKSFRDEEVSFMVGNPVNYSSYRGNQAEIDDLHRNYNMLSSTLDIDLATEMLTYGVAFEFRYAKINPVTNKREFKIKLFNSLNAYAYCNEEGEPELFLYVYKKQLDDNNIYLEVIDDMYIYHLKDDFTKVEEREPHFFKHCPVGIAALKDGFYDTLYNVLKDKQDSYSSSISDWINEIGDTRLAYLLLTGCEIDEPTAKQMKKMGIMNVKDPQGHAEWLIKNINSDFIKNCRDVLKEDIYRDSSHIDNQENVQSNTSGVMLQTRMNCLRLKITTQNQCLKDCLKSRVMDLFTFLNITEGKDYDYRDVKIEPQLNLPANDTETADIISKLNGKLSIETGLSKLSFIQDGKAEMKKMLDEQKEINKASIVEMESLPVGGETDEANENAETV